MPYFKYNKYLIDNIYKLMIISYKYFNISSTLCMNHKRMLILGIRFCKEIRQKNM